MTDPKDFAIEFGEYLAAAADRLIILNRDGLADDDEMNDAWRALCGAVYEFRKRAVRVIR